MQDYAKNDDSLYFHAQAHIIRVVSMRRPRLTLRAGCSVFAISTSGNQNPGNRMMSQRVDEPSPSGTAIEIPVNSKTLAARLGRSPGYVAAMKSRGYTFTHGMRTLLSDALHWLSQHPDFRVTGYRHNAPGFVKRRKISA